MQPNFNQKLARPGPAAEPPRQHTRKSGGTAAAVSDSPISPHSLRRPRRVGFGT